MLFIIHKKIPYTKPFFITFQKNVKQKNDPGQGHFIYSASLLWIPKEIISAARDFRGDSKERICFWNPETIPYSYAYALRRMLGPIVVQSDMVSMSLPLCASGFVLFTDSMKAA